MALNLIQESAQERVCRFAPPPGELEQFPGRPKATFFTKRSEVTGEVARQVRHGVALLSVCNSTWGHIAVVHGPRQLSGCAAQLKGGWPRILRRCPYLLPSDSMPGDIVPSGGKGRLCVRGSKQAVLLNHRSPCCRQRPGRRRLASCRCSKMLIRGHHRQP